MLGRLRVWEVTCETSMHVCVQMKGWESKAGYWADYKSKASYWRDPQCA